MAATQCSDIADESYSIHSLQSDIRKTSCVKFRGIYRWVFGLYCRMRKCVIYLEKDAGGYMRDCVGGGFGVGVGRDTFVDLRFGARDLGLGKCM